MNLDSTEKTLIFLTSWIYLTVRRSFYYSYVFVTTVVARGFSRSSSMFLSYMPNDNNEIKMNRLFICNKRLSFGGISWLEDTIQIISSIYFKSLSGNLLLLLLSRTGA